MGLQSIFVGLDIEKRAVEIFIIFKFVERIEANSSCMLIHSR